MSDLDKVYFDATSVDINEQIDIWDERGKGYYGEYIPLIMALVMEECCIRYHWNRISPKLMQIKLVKS